MIYGLPASSSYQNANSTVRKFFNEFSSFEYSNSSIYPFNIFLLTPSSIQYLLPKANNAVCVLAWGIRETIFLSHYPFHLER